MGHWGVKSYENDAAGDAIDEALERVHGDKYDGLMDDRNPLTFDQVQTKLASPETLASAVEVLMREAGEGTEPDAWDDELKLAFAGVVVRHAEAGVSIPDAWRERAIDWLQGEPIEWAEGTLRKLRKQVEIGLLQKLRPGGAENHSGNS